jgi:hypothetical protein
MMNSGVQAGTRLGGRSRLKASRLIVAYAFHSGAPP